jgi:hypothetical protein
LAHETGRVFRASAIDNLMLSYMTTAVKRRRDQSGGHLEEVQLLSLFRPFCRWFALHAGAENG